MPRKKEEKIDAYVGARVRMRRLMLGMSQEALGAHLSLTFQQIQKYEKGINRISASRLFGLGRALSVPVSYFFDGLEGLNNWPEHDGMREGPAVSPYLYFVSSSEGIQLNRAFLQIEDGTTRRKILAIVEDLARVAGDLNS
jgi:transcriptional regulator with XRE-family HTH domain